MFIEKLKKISLIFSDIIILLFIITYSYILQNGTNNNNIIIPIRTKCILSTKYVACIYVYLNSYYKNILFFVKLDEMAKRMKAFFFSIVIYSIIKQYLN